MNILTDILSLLKRKQYTKALKADDVIVVGVHEEPDMLGVASPIPYKSVRLAKLSDLNSYLEDKIDIRQPFDCPVGDAVDTSVINIAREDSESYESGLTHFNQRVTLNGNSAATAFLVLGKHQLDSSYNSLDAGHLMRLTNQWHILNHNGEGSFLSLNGVINNITISGATSKSITDVFGSQNTITINDNALNDIENVTGITSSITINGENTAIDNVYGTLIEYTTTPATGTSVVENLNGLYIDIQDSVGVTINNYKGIYHNAEPSTVTSAHFIYSELDAPSYFTGSVQAKDFKFNAFDTPTGTSTGTPGEIRVDADYIYVCVAADTWKRVLLTAF